MEKLRLGMLPLLKKSSLEYDQTRPLDLKPVPFMENALCTDDVEPDGIISDGLMDNALREVLANGIPPAVAYRWATLNGARHYQFKDLGAIGPGYLADILLLRSLEEVRVCDVIANGKLVVADGKLIKRSPNRP